MSSIFKKYIKEKKDYKKLYESELSNRKKYEERYKQIQKDYENLQKESGIADLRVQIKKLTIDLEDKTGLLNQAQIVSDVLIERHKKIKKLLMKSKSKVSEECLAYLDGLKDEEIVKELNEKGDSNGK